MALVVLTDGVKVGDLVTVQATVDGVPVTVTCWASHLATLASQGLKVAYVALLAKNSVVTVSIPVTLATSVTV